MGRLRAAFLHLRIPFSIFLMPVYWFAVSNTDGLNVPRALLVFGILHLLVYPASNGYNSLQDRDEGSIGGLKNPPPVDRTLYYLVLLFDLMAVGIGLLVSFPFAGLVLIYLLVSKAYSHPSIRLKKGPFTSTAVIALFQGGFTYWMVRSHVGNEIDLMLGHAQEEGFMLVLACLFLMGIYPITQVYQHEEDRKNGDLTLSRLLGKRGTLLFSLLVLGAASLGLLFLYARAGRWDAFKVFTGATLLAGGWLLSWLYRVYRDSSSADFEHTMRTNAVLSLSLSAAFICASFF
jgi:1,4-dihydroxy-2-naphthoate octaprenyltransferase